jgi:hypothetical protein
MKRKGDIGSPFLIPREGLQVGDGKTLTNMKKKEEIEVCKGFH